MQNSTSEPLHHPAGEHVIARAKQEGRRLEVDIEAGTFHSGARPLPKIEAQVRLIEGLVEAETGITVEAKDGFVYPGNGHDVRRNLFKSAAHCYDKGFGRRQDMVLVDVPMRFEPAPAVIFFHPAEKGDRLSAEPPEFKLVRHTALLSLL